MSADRKKGFAIVQELSVYTGLALAFVVIAALNLMGHPISTLT